MENNSSRVNISKWLPIQDFTVLSRFPLSSLSSSLYVMMIELRNYIIQHIRNIILIINQIHEGFGTHYRVEALYNLTIELKNIIKCYKSIYATKITCSTFQTVENYKIDHLFSIIKRLLHVMIKLHYNFINEIIDDKYDDLTRLTFRLVNVYNKMLDLKSESVNPYINIFSNDCPSTLDVLGKKMSTMRILQILAKNQAEEHCYTFYDCLLKIYRPRYRENLVSPSSADEISENSSVEVYRALTKHMSPLHTTTTEVASARLLYENRTVCNNIETIQTFVTNESKKIEKFIGMFGESISFKFLDEKLFNRNIQGELEVNKRELEKISNYYRRMSWAAASEILDHVMVWWSKEGFPVYHNNYGAGVHDLQDWLHHFIQENKISLPTCVILTLLNLSDALGCHVSITCWDEKFRLAYIAAFENTSRPFSMEGTNTGHMFGEIFKLLVNLSNKCEIGSDWMIGAPLMELALSEQIIILHRLDHSIHSMRLWASQESKLIAHTWELESFFLIVKGDVDHCINELSCLKLADHTIALTTDCVTISVEVYMCARMRAKIVSEINANIILLKKSSQSSIKILAKVCRIISMANLHMCLPLADYWNKNGIVEDVLTSSYVEMYLERVLLPVLEVLEDDDEILNMVLTIMGEAWLDYIYLEQIKFSELGSHQLLRDFAHVSHWIVECPIISQKLKENLLKNEVLRRCEGVGKLLLRHPGEAIAMKKQLNISGGSPALVSLGLERMPAEMYVPNQEQWLELRAGRNYSLCGCIKNNGCNNGNVTVL